MKRVLGALVVAALLASCSALDQKINYADGSAGKDDPIGLKGKAVTVSLLGSGIKLQAVTTTTGTFDDISGIPSGVILKEWGFTLDLTTPSGGATMSGSNCPSTLTVTVNSLTLKVTDAANITGQPAPITYSPASINLTESATDCVYNVPASPIKISAKIAGNDLSNLVNIITKGGVNTVTATLDTTTSPTGYAGRTLGLQFGSGTGYIIAGI